MTGLVFRARPMGVFAAVFIWGAAGPALFAVAEDKKPQRLAGHNRPVIRLAFSGDGKQVASLGNRNGMHRAEAIEPNGEGLRIQGRPAIRGANQPDIDRNGGANRRDAARNRANDNELDDDDRKRIDRGDFPIEARTVIWDAQSGKIVHRLSEFGTTSIPFPNGQPDPDMQIDVEPEFMQFTGDGKQLILGQRMGPPSLHIFLTAGNRPPRSVQIQSLNRVQGHAFVNPAGAILDIQAASQENVVATVSLIPVVGSGNVALWNISTGRKRRDLAISPNDRASHVVFSRDGRKLIGHAFNGIYIWDVRTGKSQTIEFRQGDLGETPQNNKFPAVVTSMLSDDGNTLTSFVSGGEKAIYRWDVRTGNLLDSVGTGMEMNARDQAMHSTASFSPDGSLLAVIERRERVLLIDVETGNVVGKIVPEKQKPLCLAFSPDGKQLATGGDVDFDVLIWSVEEAIDQ